MAVARRIALNSFRTLTDPLSGELHVKCGSSRRRGAHKSHSGTRTSSRKSQAGSDDGSGPTAGESAHTSAAHASDRKPCADLAGGDGGGSTCAPNSRKQRGKSVDTDETTLLELRKALQGGRELPMDGRAFLEAVNRQIDVVTYIVLLMRSQDDKLAGRLIEMVLEFGYGRNSRAVASSGAAGPLIDCAPRPIRD
jgi:hypothetical protein